MLSRPGRGGGLPDHPRLGEDDGERVIAPRSRRSPRTAPHGPRWTRAATCAAGRSASSSSVASSRSMHQRAVESDIIIVNHHLFFADLALKDEEYGAIIPEYSCRHLRRSARDRGCRRPVLRRSSQQLRSSTICAATSASSRGMKKFGSAELDRILQHMRRRSGRAVLRALRQGRGPYGVHASTTSFLDTAWRSLRRLAARRIELIGVQLEAASRTHPKRSSRCPAPRS